MIGYMAVEAETTKLAICQIEMDFLARAPLGADAKAITDDQHPDHQFGIDRWATNRAVKGRPAPTSTRQARRTCRWTARDGQQDVPFKRELIKQKQPVRFADVPS
jgi:hypothetical protein